MGALFDPVNLTGRRGVRWGLVLHTVTMFALMTISVAMGLNLQTISHVDNRGFPADGQFPPGPIGYKEFIYTKPISLIPNLVFQLNQWLADGLLVFFVLLNSVGRCLTWDYPSSIVATLSMPRITGLLPSPA